MKKKNKFIYYYVVQSFSRQRAWEIEAIYYQQRSAHEFIREEESRLPSFVRIVKRRQLAG